MAPVYSLATKCGRTGATTVRLAQTGWKAGDEWDKAFDYLATGNARLLEALYHRFAAGPEAWK